MKTEDVIGAEGQVRDLQRNEKEAAVNAEESKAIAELGEKKKISYQRAIQLQK